MGFLGLELEPAAPQYRKRRFAAFAIDLILVVMIWFFSYQLFGTPDFMSVKTALDAAQLLPVELQPEAMLEVFSKFNEAYLFGLILWFGYDVLTTLVLNGRTIGKLITGLQIVPINPERNRILSYVLLPVRSLVKILSLSLLQGFPFIICGLTVFTTKNRSGFDVFVRTCVTERGTGS